MWYFIHFSLPIEYHKAINIIAIQSFWIIKPFTQSVMDAFEQFKSCGYTYKLKTQITSESIALGHEDLLAFLYDQIIKIWKLFYVCTSLTYNLDLSCSIIIQRVVCHCQWLRDSSTPSLPWCKVLSILPHVFLFMYLYFQNQQHLSEHHGSEIFMHFGGQEFEVDEIGWMVYCIMR